MTERLPQNYIPTSYDLFIHIIKKKKKVDASVCIHFKKNGDSDEIVLSLEDLHYQDYRKESEAEKAEKYFIFLFFSGGKILFL